MHEHQKIDDFLNATSFAVVGASTSRAKYGNMVFRCLLEYSDAVVPVNPNAKRVEGIGAHASLTTIDPAPEAISIITQPDVTEEAVRTAITMGIRHIWLQPGAENAAAINMASEAGCNLIHSGPCLLVVLGMRRHG